MSHYDSLYENMSIEEMDEEINRAKQKLNTFKSQHSELANSNNNFVSEYVASRVGKMAKDKAKQICEAKGRLRALENMRSNIVIGYDYCRADMFEKIRTEEHRALREEYGK